MSEINAAVLRLAREARDMTQADLAEASGIPQGTISKVENGLLELDDRKVSALADALAYPLELLKVDPDAQAVLALFNRKLLTTPAGKRRTAEARVNLARLHLSRLLTGVNVNAPYPFPKLDLENFDGDIEEAAALVRTAWRLPMGPIRNLTATLEAAGGIVATLDFGSLKIDAASQWPLGDRPYFFLRPGLPGDRLRFNLAHEIGHMVLHELPDPEQEMQAHTFAGALLVPAPELRAQIPRRITLAALLELKLYWKVSMAAIVMRGAQIGAITERQKRSFFQMVNARGMRHVEPGKIPPEEPRTVASVVDTHLDTMGYSPDELGRVALLRPDELLGQFAPRRLGARRLRVV